MTISEKLALIAENQQKVYEAGKAAGGTDNLYYANKLNSAFSGAIFPEDYEFVQRFKNVTDSAYMFNLANNLKSIKISLETAPESISCSNMFAFNLVNTPTLEMIDLTELNTKPSNSLNMFRYQRVLKRILGELDLSATSSVANMFQNCEALVDVEFTSQTIKISISFAWSSNLSDASIQSIIDGLVDLTGSTTQTISWHSTVLDKLTTEQYDQIIAKNWSFD